jgi:hypothetical protein
MNVQTPTMLRTDERGREASHVCSRRRRDTRAIPRRSSPSRCHFRPHLRSTFGFRLRPVGDASPYSQPVLGAAVTVLDRESPFNSAATGPRKPVSLSPCAERAPCRSSAQRRQPELPDRCSVRAVGGRRVAHSWGRPLRSRAPARAAYGAIPRSVQRARLSRRGARATRGPG